VSEFEKMQKLFHEIKLQYAKFSIKSSLRGEKKNYFFFVKKWEFLIPL